MKRNFKFLIIFMVAMVLLAIYAASRQKLKRKSEIEKMNIKDL